MFLILVLLFLATASIDATFPELPDVNSFMPSLFEMMPINGQLRVNDQVFNFGSTTTPSSDTSNENQEQPRVESPEIPSDLSQRPDFESRGAESLPSLPNATPQNQPQINEPVNESNFGQRASNQLPQPIADSFPLSFPSINDNFATNFETRIPSLDSILSNLRNSQKRVINSLPNMGSTEMGSAFAQNANTNFREQFPQQSNEQVNASNFDQRTSNQLPQPIADFFPQSLPVMNFETRNPQNSVMSSLPNMGSTEMDSTFAQNANTNFREQFPQQSNEQVNASNFDQRTSNQLPQPIADFFPQSLPVMNFETRNPQNSVMNSPNIGSLEVGSTFARNANSTFRDEFSQPPSTPVAFGFQGRGARNEVNPFRLNLASTESPFVVVPLVVSPNRLTQRNDMSSNPLPIPALFARNENERMSASERIESFPVSVESLFNERNTNGSADHSAQVVSRQSTIIVPPSMFRELTNESFPEGHNFDLDLDRHVMTILRNSSATERTSATIPSDSSELRSQEMPTLAQLEESEKQKSQSTQKTDN